jgi:hypothetical protein
MYPSCKRKFWSEDTWLLVSPYQRFCWGIVQLARTEVLPLDCVDSGACVVTAMAAVAPKVKAAIIETIETEYTYIYFFISM